MMGTVAGKDQKRSQVATYSRRAHHAGSWYPDDSKELDSQLGKFMGDAGKETPGNDGNFLRGIICPHAGYSYSGPTAGYSYHYLKKELVASNITKILILHPSHHVYLDGCAVSGGSILETPIGNLSVDDALREEILGLGSDGLKFEVMKQAVDEHEHSGEMQYPFIAKVLSDTEKLDAVQVLPIMCGSISSAKEESFGKLLAPIIARPNVLCVISTDFCHWGSRFQYSPVPGKSSSKEIYEYIRELDNEGMKHIELNDPGAFSLYLKQTRNTICGRHAIGVWLNAVNANTKSSTECLDISFVKYAQSSAVRSTRDSSVSYASAVARRTRDRGGSSSYTDS